MDVESKAKELHEGFNDDVDIPVEDVEAQLESFVEFGVQGDEAVNSTLTKIAADHDIDRAELTGGSGGGGDGYPHVDIADIDEEDQWVTIKGRVDTLWEDNPDSISQAGLIDDGTSRIKFIAWSQSEAPLLAPNEAYELRGVVTDEYNGRYEVKINSQTEIEQVDEEFESSNEQKEIGGAIVGLQNGSGLIERTLEGDVVGDDYDGETEFDIRLMAVLDTGDDTYTAVFGDELTEEITGIDVDEAQDIAREKLDKDAVVDEMVKRADLIGNYYDIVGNLSGDWIFVDEAERDTDFEDPESLLVKARAL